MAAQLQAGDAVIIGFQSFAWSGYVAEDGMTWTNGYNREESTMGQDGSTRSKIRMDEYEELAGSVIVDDPGDDSETISFKPGDTVSITTPDGASETWEVQSAPVALAAGALKINFTLRKEVSMTY